MDDCRRTFPTSGRRPWSESLSSSSLRTFSQRPFVRNLAQLSGATTIGGFIAVGASPIVTRLYSPGEFGVLGVFATVLAVVVAVAALRYEYAVPYPAGETEAAAVLALALLTVLGTSAVCAVLIGTGVLWRLPGINGNMPRGLLWWLPVGMWASGTYTALSVWMIRHRDFVTIGKTKITQGALQVLSQIALGVARIGASGLIVGQIIGSSGGLLRLYERLRRESPDALRNLSYSHLREAAIDFKRFPLLSAPAVLLDAATGAMPLLFIAAQFGSSPAGLYTLIQRVVTMPFSLLTVNLGQIVFGDLAELRRSNPDAVAATFRRRVLQVAALGLAIMIPLLIVVPLLLPAIFGQRWAEARVYFLILSPMIYAGFVSSPFGWVIDVLRRQDLHLLRDSVRALIIALSLVLCVQLQAGVKETLGIISAAGTISGAFFLYISYRIVVTHARSVERIPPALAT